MDDRASSAGSIARQLGIAGLPELPHASCLLSSRWSRDNLITSHPARLYDGRVLERIDASHLDSLLTELRRELGPFEAGAVRLGVFTWDILCESESGPFVVQLPLVLDERGAHGRSKRELPALNVENMQYYRARGLSRFVLEPRTVLTLDGGIPAATFGACPQHHPVSFGAGCVRVTLADSERSWLVSLGRRATAEVLAETVAALTYHYEPELEDGTALTDVALNDGDFVARRRADGSFELRLTAARQRQSGISPNLLLLYLIQLLAYEDFDVAGELRGLPVLASNPSVAFEGLVRGRSYLARDRCTGDDSGAREARSWIRDFANTREGRAYRPWVERFLAGTLPLEFGTDPRERWWRLMPLETTYGVSELQSRLAPSAAHSATVRTLRVFLDRLAREIGHFPDEEPTLARINDASRTELETLLSEAIVPAADRSRTAADILNHWPYRSLDHLLARVPAAKPLRRLKSRLSLGRILPDAVQGTLDSLGPVPKTRPSRPLANHEVFSCLPLPTSLYEAAVAAFPSFEAYMDAALHDPEWGYYGHSVVIGSSGHFDTHPETLSPHYGRWLAAWAFRTYRELVEKHELVPEERFVVVEFGAGNGRLACDFLDAVARLAADAAAGERPAWRAFAERLEYRIYETSASLRDKQQALLGDRALVRHGDARHPAAALGRDFPSGLKGFVVTNEVPDAFGVHKLVLSAEGSAAVALVVPRIENAAREALSAELARRLAGVDADLRQRFGFASHPADSYLDAEAFALLMRALATLAPSERDALLGALWFEETYVPVSRVPKLAAHLRDNANQYATALAAEDSGVVLYVNLHADDFIAELATSLRAGSIVTIDYGDSTWRLVQGARRGDFPFRVYGAWEDYRPRPNDPYAAPGTQDLTADVNFTALARCGRAAGLELVHFGLERDLAADQLPDVLEAGRTQETFYKFVGNPLFKVLVLGKATSERYDSSLLTPLPLEARAEDVPKSRRHRIFVLERALRDLALRIESRA